MKKILYMAISINGLIAKRNDDTSWISDEEWESYQAITKKVRCSIIGRRTYDLMKPEDFLKGCFYIVLTKTAKNSPNPLVIFVKTPSQALAIAQKKRLKEVLIAGGGKLNSSFLQRGLVDEIYLDVEPMILGEGIPVFALGDFKYKLQLIGTKKLSQYTLQLRYKVLK